MNNARLSLRLSAAAEKDYRDVLRWSLEYFGADQARAYAITIGLALRALGSGSTPAGARERSELGPGMHSLHIARQARKGRHVIYFRTDLASACIDVIRILHDRMDPQRHLDAGS